jgi:uncharacterized lipoprotein
MNFARSGAALLAVLILSACGGGEETKGQPSADERRALDNIAAKQDAEAAETFDTSPDSLVPAEGAAVDGNAVDTNESAANAAALAPANNDSAANTAAPR